MGTKTIGLREDVYERLRARKREGESFTELVDRLIDEAATDWRETFGTLSSEEARELEALVRQSRETAQDGFAHRQREAIGAFADADDQKPESEESSEGSDGS